MSTRVKARQGQQKQKLAQNWKFVFLETLAETSNVRAACRESGAEPSYAYKHRRQDDAFRRKWQQALLEGYEHLELETLERLRFGVGSDDKKFDIPNALRLLTAHKEAAAQEKARRGKRDRQVVLARLSAKLETMRTRKLAAQRLLATDGVTVISNDDR